MSESNAAFLVLGGEKRTAARIGMDAPFSPPAYGGRSLKQNTRPRNGELWVRAPSATPHQAAALGGALDVRHTTISGPPFQVQISINLPGRVRNVTWRKGNVALTSTTSS